ncbi:hypothetical protein Clacol_004772 [Clathrus columnatus]|uniref:Eukaryotic translation initiation factor 3 subunit G n=1 Tax=Clathrus columnatus TaxID=1419009 RepID=A0AAV5A8D1_9AGAM|nr:hypothetical protein Clacol_004772 [Clathrus columnatus]
MRVQNLQELIYKRGQAGITKASVTIVFDNSDRALSPVGLENCKQITVTRQIALPNISKYLLNGHKTQMHTILTMFQSIQLNINNPNFVIMQGKITKVLNMRPPEILTLLSEASGTLMFEDRKSKANKTISKKLIRIAELTDILREEITPKLDKLRSEKRAYLAYQKTCEEIGRIGNLLQAWDWWESSERVHRRNVEIERRENELESTKSEAERLKREIESAERQKRDLEKEREDELRKSGSFAEREREVKSIEKDVVKLRTQAEIKAQTVTEEETAIRSIEEECKTLREALEEKRREVEKLQKGHDALKEQQMILMATLSKDEDLLQSLLTGLSNNSNTNGGGYLAHLANAKSLLAQAIAEEEQLRRRISMKQKEMKTLEENWKAIKDEARQGRIIVEGKRSEMERLKIKFEDLAWNEVKECEIVERNARLKHEIKAKTEKRDYLRTSIPALDFQYTPPSSNFDVKAVKGPISGLISLSPEHHHRGTALEVAAGGRLYHVVVKDEDVGKALLQHGKLKKRVTLIPLSKISPSGASGKQLQQRLATAKRSGGTENVHLALDLLQYTPELANAMAYVFGDTVICDTPDAARAVSFSGSGSNGMKCVTLTGDIYDPSGTLSGGAAPSGSGLLLRVQDYRVAQDDLDRSIRELCALQDEETSTKAIREQWLCLKRELEIKRHELNLVEAQVGTSNANRLSEEIEAAKKSIGELQVGMHTCIENQKLARAECAKLESDMSEFKNDKEGKIKELKEVITQHRGELQKQNSLVKVCAKELQMASLEFEQLESDILSSDCKLSNANESAAKTRKELNKSLKELASLEAAFQERDQALQAERQTLTRFDNEIGELERAIKEKAAQKSETELSFKKFDHEIVNLKKDKANALTRIHELEGIHQWMKEEKSKFGQPNTPYDFAAQDMGQVREKYKELEESHKGLKKNINPKVLNMIDGVEKREASLKKMLATVMRDKAKIEETIAELDRYKRDALYKTWEKVNSDFGGIFSELLPGNFAKLQPPEGKDLTNGLEVKVQLGSVWKQSLTELSGGQRSLIALSLIMALLQFKPAPMYILDEIDAALDLSHTQHIGQLFRTRFKGSQFIVVSLKEGLFTNANVLFRARFRDGTSVVERTAQRSTSGLYVENAQQYHQNENKENYRHIDRSGTQGRRARRTPKKSWADYDVDEPEQTPSRIPGIISDTVDENGIRTIVEYTVDDEGKKVKVTRRIKRTLQKQLVNHRVAERKHWNKFGQEKGNKPGPDRATTTVGESVTLKLSIGNKTNEPEPTQEQQVKNSLANKKISCRLCKGDHFTSKCPYKDTLGVLDGADTPPVGDDDGIAPATDAPAAPSTGKYVPPSMRGAANAGRGGESMFRSREDLPTLRVTNVSEDTTDNDLRDLFSNFGRVVRVYIGRDRDTGIGKGYAFVSFEDRAAAQKAMDKVHGMGYDNLILNCQWSQPREQRGGV